VKQEPRDSVEGMVVSRECPLCGHHEIGFVTQDGEFHSLKPGTPIRLHEPLSPVHSMRDHLGTPLQTEEEEQVAYRIWVPEPLRGDRVLRIKYSVIVKEHLFKGEMSGALYELAYVEKLEKLIEKVLDIPLPVILDRFFAAPHLASGNPREIAEVMYRELDEIKHPVALMRNWLEVGDAESLDQLIKPKSRKDLGHEPTEDETVKEELGGLTFEEFLEML
jgi:hypothetical protein